MCEESVETFDAKNDVDNTPGSDDEDKLIGSEWDTEKDVKEQVRAE